VQVGDQPRSESKHLASEVAKTYALVTRGLNGEEVIYTLKYPTKTKKALIAEGKAANA